MYNKFVCVNTVNWQYIKWYNRCTNVVYDEVDGLEYQSELCIDEYKQDKEQ